MATVFVWLLTIEDVSVSPYKKIRSRAFRSYDSARQHAEEYFGSRITWRASRSVVCSPVLDGLLYSIRQHRIYP